MTPIGMFFFNRLIFNLVTIIVGIEENYTKTANVISIMNKGYFSHITFFIIPPLAVSGFSEGNYDGPRGVAGQVHDFQLVVFCFTILFNLINIPHRLVMLIECISCLRRRAIKYLCRITGEFDTYDEMREALTFLYDPPLMPIAGLYVYITIIFTHAFFFCHLQPVILFYLIFNLIVFHLVNKYLLMRMSKIPDIFDVNIFETVIGFALNVPLGYGIATIIFLSQKT